VRGDYPRGRLASAQGLADTDEEIGMGLQPACKPWLCGAFASLMLVAAAPASAQIPTVPNLPQAPQLPAVPDLPDVPHVPGVPEVDVPSPDDVVNTVQNTVNQVTGGGGGGGGGTSGTTPATTDPAAPTNGGSGPVVDATDPTGGSPAPDPGSGTDPTNGSGSGNGANGDGQGRGTTGSNPATPAGGTGTPSVTAAGASGQARGAQQTSKAEDRTFATRIGDTIASLPTGLLIGLFGLGAIALLMTGRSAWFARATNRLKLQRTALRGDVGVLQSALVPNVPPTIAGSAIAVAFRPAAGPAAGGDFHDVFELEDDRIGIVVGDVSGHGPDALPATGIVRYTIRAYLEAGLEPRAALRLADRALSSSLGDDFATAIAAIYDSRSGRLTYSCAGHPAPLIVGGHEHRGVAVLSAPPIGLNRGTGSRQSEVSIGAEGRVWFFTDGLTEAHDEDEPQLGRDGLEADIADPELQPAQLLSLVAGRAGGTDDDMTAVRLEPAGAGAAEPMSIEILEALPGVDGAALSEFLAECGVKAQRAGRVVSRVTGLGSADGAVVIKVTTRGSRVICDVSPLAGTRRDRDRADVSASATAISETVEATPAPVVQPAS
jgi:stage II sporulation SpoE-like protein